jgi:Fe-S-cluster containining protein
MAKKQKKVDENTVYTFKKLDNSKLCKNCMSKCKAECCAGAAVPKDYLTKFASKFCREVYGYVTMPKTDIVFPITSPNDFSIENPNFDKQICPFLRKTDNKCAIYEDRPLICSEFGSYLEEDNTLTCQYHIDNRADKHCRTFTQEEKEFSINTLMATDPTLVDRLYFDGKM